MHSFVFKYKSGPAILVIQRQRRGTCQPSP